MPRKRIRIGDCWVGDGEPCYVVAEAGSNHDKSFEQALQLVDVAARCGADAVKFQTFTAERMYLRNAGECDYLKTARSIFDIIRDVEMPRDWIPRLAEYCGERHIEFLSSPFDEESVDLLKPYVRAFKVASYEMTHVPLLRHIARLGKPMLVSVGASTLEEVRSSVDVIRSEGNEEIILLQCTASYPTAPKDVNARALVTLRQTFGLLTGLSDHSRDPVVAPVVAISLGACLIEKHFTLNNNLHGPDHKYAVEPEELASLVHSIRQAEEIMGHGRKEVLPVEEELRAFARRSIFAVREIQSGERFTRGNIAVLRSGKLQSGLEPKFFDQIIGGCATRTIKVGEGIQAADCDSLVRLRPATINDAKLLFDWRNEETTRKASFNTEPLVYEEHLRWYQQKLSDTNVRFLVAVIAKDRDAGYVRLDITGDAAEIHLSMDKQHRGKGIGSVLIKAVSALAATELEVRHLVSYIKADNAIAQAAFQRAGFSLVNRKKVHGVECVEMVCDSL